MSPQNDDSQMHGLMALGGVVALVLAGVIALAAATTMHAGRKAPPRSAATSATAVEPAVEGRIDFATGSAALPNGASAVLERVADAARADPSRVVQILSYHLASDDSAQGAEAAKQRAQAVRHALEANGVAPAQLQMDEPVLITDGADAATGRRVELRLR